MKFESIILINDLIGRIDQLSHEVRIQALNSYLVSANRSSTVGFSAVSSSLVEFSQEIEKHSSKLRAKIYETLITVTKLYKIHRNYEIILSTIQKSKNTHKHLDRIIKHHEELLNKNQEKVKEKLINLSSLVNYAIKLCKNGHYIAICSKVEVAHIPNNAKFFRLITEKVENCVLQIFQSLQSIQKEINFNLLTDS